MNREVLQGEADTPLSEVVAQMISQVQSAFVVCEEAVPVGIISERDAILVLDAALRGESFAATSAADVMASPVYTLSENEMMGTVIRVMSERQFRRVPIVDDKNQLSGIINLMDLQAATNTALERRGRDLEVAVMKRTVELLTANAKLEQLSIRDGLTGLLNRRAMGDKLTELHILSRRYGNPYSVILTDIDHFKNYNDALGHIQGDVALKRISKLLERSIRESDSVYRYGGEEFLIAMPETGHDSAGHVAERIRSEVEREAIPHPESSCASVVTLSLGHAVITGANASDYATWEEVVEQADRALYRAKQGGRNCVVGSNE